MKRARRSDPADGSVIDGSDRYWLACATAAGRLHRDALRNNQDAVASLARGESFAVCVSDGCSALPAAEIGAQLTARRAVFSAVEWAEAHPQSLPSQAMEFVLDDVCSMIKRVANAVGGADHADEVIADLLLSTMLVALATPRGLAIFGVGDGIVALGHDVRVLRTDRGGPAYPAYRFTTLGAPPSAQLFFVAGAGDQRVATIGTDGAESLFSQGKSPLTALSSEALSQQRSLRWALETQVTTAAQTSADDLSVAMVVPRVK